MRACKSQYDYAQLVSNYISYNTNDNIVYNNGESLPSKFTSTAKGRLSFDGPYLVSYNTRVAKFVHTKKATYILMDEYKYSTTTTKHLNNLRSHLRSILPNNVTPIYVTDLDSSFNELKEEYVTAIHNSYKHCKRARNGKRLQEAIEEHKAAILSIIPELHPSTRKATLRKLNALPNVPSKLNKFTRPVMLSLLKDKGLL